MATATKPKPLAKQATLFQASTEDARYPLKAFAAFAPEKRDPPAEAEAPEEGRFQRPAKRLDDVEPVVGSQADIDLALKELSWLALKTATADKLLNAELDAVRKKYARHFQVDATATADVGEPAPQTLAQRRQQLEAAVVTFAKANRAELLPNPDKLKSKDFALGVVTFKAAAESVMPLQPTASDADGDVTDQPKPTDKELFEKALDELLVAHELPNVIERALKKKCKGTGRPLVELLRFSWAWSLSSILATFKAKTLTNDQLNTIGLKVDRNEETVSLTLKS